MNTHEQGPECARPRLARSLARIALCGFICAQFCFLLSCSSKITDLRTLAPPDALVYLETNDLGTALTPINTSGLSGSEKPDLSSLSGVQLAIVITGFETTEQKINEEQSSAQIRPKFVAIADTHAWHFQAVRFAEERLGAVVEKFYGSKPKLETTETNGGRAITWTAADGRKAFAFVTGSIVYLSNDRPALDKTLAVRSGMSNLASTGQVGAIASDEVAAGYISPSGVAQLSDLISLRMAAAGSEDPQVRSTVASILPPLIREMVTEVRWTARVQDHRTVDAYDISMPENIRSALNGSTADELGERLRNAVVGLLRDSKLDDNTRSEVAELIASAADAGPGAQTSFTPSGMRRTVVSDSGLIGQIAAAISAP